MKNKPPEFSDLMVAALGAVHALGENEIALIGTDEVATMRAKAVVAQLHYVLNRIRTAPLSRRSKVRLADMKRRCIEFQNSSHRAAVMCKMDSPRTCYRDLLSGGLALCADICPQAVDVYRMAFGAP